MNRSATCLLAVFLGLSVAQAKAQQYRWIDEKGRVQYTDTPPPASAKGVQKKNFNPGKPLAPAEPYALQVARKTSPVKLYSASDCAACDRARDYLNQRGIPFEEVSVVSEAQHLDLTAVSGGSSVPVMQVAGQIQRGFEESAYASALDAAGYPKRGELPARNQVAPPAPALGGSASPATAAGKPPAIPPAASPSK